jgi:hypothetical protein
VAPAEALKDLYRVAILDQLLRLEEDPVLGYKEKLGALDAVLKNLLGIIDRLSRPAPQAAPELWSGRPQKNAEDIHAFISRVYAEHSKRGMTMADLMRLDPKAYRAWYDWRKLSRNRGVEPPLLRRSQATDQTLAKLGGNLSVAGIAKQLPPAVRDLLRLKGAVVMRRRRQAASKNMRNQ